MRMSSLYLLLSWFGETEVLQDHLEVGFFPCFRLNLLGGGGGGRSLRNGIKVREPGDAGMEVKDLATGKVWEMKTCSLPLMSQFCQLNEGLPHPSLSMLFGSCEMEGQDLFVSQTLEPVNIPQ